MKQKADAHDGLERKRDGETCGANGAAQKAWFSLAQKLRVVVPRGSLGGAADALLSPPPPAL